VAVSSALPQERPQTTQGARQRPKTEDAPLPPSPRLDARSRSLTCPSQRKRQAPGHPLTPSPCDRHGSNAVSRGLALHLLGPRGPIGLRKHTRGVDRCPWQHSSGRIRWILDVQLAQVLAWFTHMALASASDITQRKVRRGRRSVDSREGGSRQDVCYRVVSTAVDQLFFSKTLIRSLRGILTGSPSTGSIDYVAVVLSIYFFFACLLPQYYLHPFFRDKLFLTSLIPVIVDPMA